MTSLRDIQWDSVYSVQNQESSKDLLVDAKIDLDRESYFHWESIFLKRNQELVLVIL